MFSPKVLLIQTNVGHSNTGHTTFSYRINGYYCYLHHAQVDFTK
jgi:hypothetical protein